ERIGHNSPHGHRNCLCDHNSELALRDGRKRAGFVEFRSEAKIPPQSVCTSTPTTVPSGRTRIFIRPEVGTAREAPIQNWHFDPRLPRLRESLAEPTRGAAQSQRSEVVFNSTRDLLPSSDSLDYANRWRSPHVEPPSHSDRKSCSTRREICSAGRGYGCPNIADIVTPPVYSYPFSERIGHNFPHGHRNCLCDRNSESALRDGRKCAGFAEFRSGAKIPPGACVLVHRLLYPPVGRGYLFARGSEQPARPQFRIGTSTRSDSLDYANRWRSPHAEPPNHIDRKSCSTRCEICYPGREYGCPNIVDIVTTSVATPSITRISGGAHKQSRPVTLIGSRVQLDARSAPQVV
ncbi:hypothetical protein Taro_019821, partial [Colocasia esculenta]|nr:hypothetical protein [Colocasia esculenta]